MIDKNDKTWKATKRKYTIKVDSYFISLSDIHENPPFGVNVAFQEIFQTQNFRILTKNDTGGSSLKKPPLEKITQLNIINTALILKCGIKKV